MSILNQYFTDNRINTIVSIRMEKGHELLESGKCTVGEVPEQIGMRDIKNFSKQYKLHFNMTPSKSIKKVK